MWKRFKYLVFYFIILMSAFALQKPLFMLYNGSLLKKYVLMDYLQVMLSGIKLDSTMTSYIILIPSLLIFISLWYERLPWIKILRTYNVFVAILIAVVFVVDTSLYAFWGFKLDATVFNYLDSPTEVFASVSFGYVLLRILIILFLVVLFSWILNRVPLKITVLTNLRKKLRVV